MSIEFLPWYQAGASMVRCEGDDGCGALLVEADVPRHVRWHERMFPYDVPLPKPGPTVLGKNEW